MDYNGVAAKVKDYLRATLVVTTMPEVCRVWSAVEELKAQGQLEVVGIKNRLRGKATNTGYRDINMSVKFRGHVCEIQIQLAVILEVKHDGTEAYELVRSLELEDELEEGPTLADLAGACSQATRVALGALRFFVAMVASLISAIYIMFGVMYDSEDTRWIGAVREGVREGTLAASFENTPPVDCRRPSPTTARMHTHALTHTHTHTYPQCLDGLWCR